MDNSITQDIHAGKQERVNTLQDYRPLSAEQVPSMDHRRPDRGMLGCPVRDGGHHQGSVRADRAGRPQDDCRLLKQAVEMLDDDGKATLNEVRDVLSLVRERLTALLNYG